MCAVLDKIGSYKRNSFCLYYHISGFNQPPPSTEQAETKVVRVLPGVGASNYLYMQKA